MSSPPKQLLHHASSSKLPKNPATIASTATMSTTITTTNINTIHMEPRNPNLNPNPITMSNGSPISMPQEDLVLSHATHLTHRELLRRRSRHLKQLSKCYRDHYWALMEELKVQYREYYWRYGLSPFKEDQSQNQQRSQQGGPSVLEGENGQREAGVNYVEGSGENVNENTSNTRNDLDLKNNRRCSFVGCKLKAMALTSFCHLHILSDSKQKLYKACSYVIKSAQAGPITCGKPILRSTVPSLCNVHFQKAQKHVTRALKKAGLNSSSSKLAPKFHVIVAEYVRHIQAKRRAVLEGNKSKVTVSEESPI